ncbi:MAG: hypothetical protein ACD_3C00149G0006 [uncultured bacterium (gcode 4)]|uniref:Uncharacterized protein n=1 Tax=uncultured bacterium (gcode 4) TaxID=1234023 RepID=K2GWR5_9BACT|nr:MAG: hypothetical protein ACD_3C00149G0006 [uncultured bacterium (gcode 4)]
MKNKIFLIILSSFLLFSCWNNAEDTSKDSSSYSATWTNNNVENSSAVSTDTSNEATEVPEDVSIGSWETATVTEFSAATWTILK